MDGARVLSCDELRELATDQGLEHLADEIVSRARLAVVLHDVGEHSGGELRSQLGGRPALPDELEWPEWRGRPLSFLAQIRLDEVAPFDEESLLPPEGVLLVFRDSAAVAAAAGGDLVDDEAGWGFDPADAGSARVFHVASASLARREAPNGMPAHGVLPQRAVEPRGRLTLLPWEAFFESPQDADVDRYIALQEAVDAAQGLTDDSANHQLLGHPDRIQGDMQLECQLVTHGIYCGDTSGYEDPRVAELAGGASDWRLLFQLGTDEEGLGVMWGDVGKLYFWIRRQDLAARRFDATWTILQCY